MWHPAPRTRLSTPPERAQLPTLRTPAGASLLVFANKQDIQGALKPSEIAKAKCSPVKHFLPSTSMAAHAINDLNEAIELEDRQEAIDSLLENDDDDKTRSPVIPLQPLPGVQNAYEQVIKI
ncbi:hypothetical protein ABZP36_014121 [Zizania latifolia]